MLRRLIPAAALALLLAPAAAVGQSCDLSDLPCAQDGEKCNIHFDNRTGLDENTCKKTNSYSQTETVKISAKDDSNKILGNTLSITAGAKGTMNLSNSAKKNTSHIKAGTQGLFSEGTLTCDDIRTVLKGSGKCKIYNDKEGYTESIPFGHLYFDCSGGDVCTTD